MALSQPTFAGFYGANCSEEQGIAVLQQALKAGAKTISTADFYGSNGENETLIGMAPCLPPAAPQRPIAQWS